MNANHSNDPQLDWSSKCWPQTANQYPEVFVVYVSVDTGNTPLRSDLLSPTASTTVLREKWPTSKTATKTRKKTV